MYMYLSVFLVCEVSVPNTIHKHSSFSFQHCLFNAFLIQRHSKVSMAIMQKDQSSNYGHNLHKWNSPCDQDIKWWRSVPSNNWFWRRPLKNNFTILCAWGSFRWRMIMWSRLSWWYKAISYQIQLTTVHDNASLFC